MTREISATQYQEAIVAAHGILSSAARRLGCSRTAIHKACKRHPTVQKALDEARDEILDLAESRLFEAVNAGSLPAVMFMLSTIGRDRGYVTRQEVDEGTFKTPDEISAMSNEEFSAYRREMGFKK